MRRISFIILLFLAGCQSGNKQVFLLEGLVYNYIVITEGSNGAKYTFDSSQDLQEISDIINVPLTNELEDTPGTGYLYRVSLYNDKGDEIDSFTFNNNYVKTLHHLYKFDKKVDINIKIKEYLDNNK